MDRGRGDAVTGVGLLVVISLATLACAGVIAAVVLLLVG
jgi:hypothetical protein